MKRILPHGRPLRGLPLYGWVVLLAACDSGDPSRPDVAPTVAVTPTEVTLAVGESQTLAATIQGAAGSGVTWESSPASVARVSVDGVVTGLRVGAATVTARSVADPRGSGTATIVVAEPPSDLTVISVSVPATAAAGDTIEIASTIRNLGPATTVSFTAGTYFSTDSVITTADLFSNYWCRYSGMEAGFTSSCGGKIVVPPALSAGSYWIGVIVDDQGRVTETDETNNAKAPAAATAVTPRR